MAPLKRKGNLFSESNENAKILVEQFYSVFGKKENRTKPNLPKGNKSDLPSLNITTPGIEKLLKKINVSKSFQCYSEKLCITISPGTFSNISKVS